MAARKQSREERFLKWTDRSGQCWLWTGALFPDGRYGKMQVNGRTISAHRAMWEWKFGPVPDDQFVLHRCDVMRCVRPDHLFLGDHQSNMDDKVFKGRQANGETFASSKLTQEQVDAIRRKYANGGVTQQALADEFGTTQCNISHICLRRIWKGVATP